ncbi:NAD-dependent protein deacetylase sirtuin-2 [Belonocnema kinseyi]|uniref:NAD-dependent protein deacetylase sirtuin-2 n=1 Tax=Belonocnema kinseyi TaxID=2817044 RepID=UPI00143D5DB7|nr:NAD-dependent protein deacetylase sirtuin-2 [Belonocnema kinseyi]
MDKKKEEEERESDEEPQATSSAEEPEVDEMDKIRKFLSQKLKIFDSTEQSEDEQPPAEKVLSDLSLDGIAEYIKSGKCKNIIVMAGAGISTSAGIPDFRSPSSGLYNNLQKYNLPHPQAIFEIDFFRENPEPFFVLAKELLPEGFKPTVSHYFIRLLWEKGLLLRHYTQNVDTLERVAGLPQDKLVEAHGTFYTGRCLECRAPHQFLWMKEKIQEGTIPKCVECEEGVVKPDIVFFGEQLPDRFHRLIARDFPEADLLIIMGSSLVVQPFASLVERVKSSCPRLLINKEKVGTADRLMRFLGMKKGLDFDSKDSGRDIAWLGDCDLGCQEFAEKLGWGDELKALVELEHKRLETEGNTNKL